MRRRLAPALLGVAVLTAGCATNPTTVETASPAKPSPAGEPAYTCGVGPGFTIDELWTGAAFKDDEPKRILDDYTEAFGLGDREWRRVVDDEDVVLFVGGDGSKMPYLVVELVRDTWRKASEGECTPARTRDGDLSGSWTLSPPTQIGPYTRSFTVLVSERASCVNRTDIDRVSAPEIVRTDQSVTVTFFIEAWDSRLHGCTRDPSPLEPAEVLVDLGEELGDRALFDGGTYPVQQRGRGGPGWGAASCDSEAGSQTHLDSEPHPVTVDYVHRWSHGGCLVRIDVLATSTPGPDFHCAPWPQSMTMNTPLGSTDPLSERLSYVRSSEQRWRAEGVAATFSDDLAPPPTATPTGYLSFDGAELMVDETTQDVVYLRYPDHTERWPRMAGVGCA